MSIAWLSDVWPLQTGSLTRKAVLLALADYADEDGYCWPRVKTIAARAECGERTVRRTLAELEEIGLIEVTEDYEPAGRQTSNVYRLTINKKSPPVSLAGGRVPEWQGEGARVASSTGTVIEPARRKSVRDPSDARTRTRFQSKLPDDETRGSDEPPAMGAAPASSRGSAAETVVSKRKPSANSLAHRLDKRLRELGYTVDATNVAEIRKVFRRWQDKGTDLELIAMMIDVFCGAPTRYMDGDQIPWRAFYNAREKLRVDASKRLTGKAGAARFADIEDTGPVRSERFKDYTGKAG